MDPAAPQPDNPLSRRDLIRNGAIVGGLIWAAPAMSSFGARAWAYHPACQEIWRYGPNGGVCPPTAEPSAHADSPAGCAFGESICSPAMTRHRETSCQTGTHGQTTIVTGAIVELLQQPFDDGHRIVDARAFETSPSGASTCITGTIIEEGRAAQFQVTQGTNRRLREAYVLIQVVH